MIPTSSLTSSHGIYIQFPDVYDKLLGENVYCSSSGLNSEVTCNISGRVAYITGIVSYTPSSSNPIVKREK